MKGITDVSAGASQVKSARGGKVFSAPKTKNSSYLDLFILSIERTRLSQGQANLEKRQSQIKAKMERNQKRLAEIGAELRIKARQVEEAEVEKVAALPPEAKPPSKKWQTVAVEY